ncbi:VacJ family lipoprotein [Sphingosinicella sp. LY1275]|uniref:MlaA family lipoprotein n=1 Tax=Sphingosinicella sp. LY1275 TaxID=3095379 RepID=UPI002ADEE531|nr:VacJ family lipoprotein [Sphingosinicella sp. LY1275]MEA1014385.1 VacJ family lipoprotein [Sphingosinicella sp. LY1275]
MRLILALILALPLAACATTGDRASLDPRDPYEGFNRGVWGFNQAVDKVAVKPAATIYRTVTPVPARRGISRVLSNLGEPFSFINNLLQGKPKRAFNSLGRFLVNSTIGVGGLADHATDLGLPQTREDFGQTLAVGGARKSPYLVLPILGPSTVRDAVGTAVEWVGDPARIVMGSELSTTQGYVVTGTRVVDARSRAMEDGTDSLLETSADSYAVARSAYFQRREAQINDEDPSKAQATESEEEMLEKALGDDAVTPQPDEPEIDPDSAPLEEEQPQAPEIAAPSGDL